MYIGVLACGRRLNLELTDCLDWMANECQGSYPLPLVAAVVEAAQLFMLGIQIRAYTVVTLPENIII